MKKFSEKQFSAELLYLAIFTTVTVLVWIGFEVFRSLTTSAEKIQITNKELVPLSGELKTSVLDNLRRRIQVPQETLDNIEGTGALETEEITYVTESTDSATIEEDNDQDELDNTQEATNSGNN